MMLTDGIYFKQSDQKDVGYFITNDEGELVHQDYKPPTKWQKAKYYLKYGYQMNANTLQTSFFYFSSFDKKLYSINMSGDAITLAKSIKFNRNMGKGHEYLETENGILVELDMVNLILSFSKDGLKLFVEGTYKNSNKHLSTEIYTFLDWLKL